MTARPKHISSQANTAAELALFVFRSFATGGEWTSDDVILLPAGTRMNFSKTIAALGQMPKPIDCTAEIQDGVLVLACDRSGMRSESDEALHALRQSQGIIRAIHEAAEANEATDVLVKNLEDQGMRVAINAFEEWMRDYGPLLDVSINGIPPSSEELNAGLAYVIEMGRTQQLDPAGFEDHLRRERRTE